MKKVVLSIFVCFLSLNVKSNARLTALLQKIEDLEHPFYRTTFDTLIKDTLKEVKKIEQKLKIQPNGNSALEQQFHHKINFLDSLLRDKLFYSCMTDTDMSDLKSLDAQPELVGCSPAESYACSSPKVKIDIKRTSQVLKQNVGSVIVYDRLDQLDEMAT